MKAFAAHIQFEIRNAVRDRSLLLMNYLFPLVVYLTIGAIMTKLNPTFKQALIPSMIMFGILSSMVLSLPTPLVTARESGIFRSYRINGVPTSNILIVPALTSFLHMIVVGLIILFTAGPLFGASTSIHYGWFILAFVLICFACAGFGILIGVISKDSKLTILYSQMIFLPSTMIGGIMIPASMLPGSLNRIAHLLPTSYARELFDISLGAPLTPHVVWPIFVLLSSGILCFLMASLLFRWDSQVKYKKKNPLWGLVVIAPYVAGALML
ncbi:MAG: ABC transporter permease [Bacteroidales bacterium]